MSEQTQAVMDVEQEKSEEAIRVEQEAFAEEWVKVWLTDEGNADLQAKYDDGYEQEQSEFAGIFFTRKGRAGQIMGDSAVYEWVYGEVPYQLHCNPFGNVVRCEAYGKMQEIYRDERPNSGPVYLCLEAAIREGIRMLEKGEGVRANLLALQKKAEEKVTEKSEKKRNARLGIRRKLEVA